MSDLHKGLPTPDFALQMLEAIDASILAVGPDRRVLFINGTGARALGYESNAQVLGSDYHKLVHPHCDGQNCRILAAFEKGGSIGLEEEILWRADGSCLYARCGCSSLPGTQGSVFTFSNSSARSAIREELYLQRAWLAATLTGIGDGVITTDATSDPKITFLNPVAEELTGWTLDEARGKSMGEVFVTLDQSQRSRLPDIAGRAARSGQGISDEQPVVLLSRSGREYVIEENAAPIKDSESQILGVVLVFRDRTTQERLRQENTQATRQTELERARLKALFEQAPMPMAVLHGPHHKFEFANSLYKKYFLGTQDFLGKTVSEILPDAESQGFVALLDGVYAGGQRYIGKEARFEFVVPGEPVQELYLNFVYEPLRDVDGNVEGVLAVISDVTEQITAREELLASKNDLVDTLDSMSDAFFSLDKHFTIVRVNSNMEKLTGLGGSEQVGKNFFELYFPDPAQRDNQYWRQYRKAMSERVAIVFEEHLERLGIWTQCRVYPKTDGGLAIFYTDITEQKLSQDQLAFERHKLETIFEQTPAAMAIWRGKDLVFEKINSQYQEIFGDRQLLGKPILEALPELQGQEFPNLLVRVLESGQPYVGREMLAQVARGDNMELEDIYYDFTYLRIDDPNGNPYGVYDHAIDVTDRVLARLELERSQVSLKRNQEQLSRAIEVAKIGFYDWDMVANHLVFSEQMKKDWDFEGGAEVNVILSHVHPEDQNKVSEALYSAIDSRTMYFCEYRVVRGDGRTIWVEAQGECTYDAKGTPVRFVGTCIDISERKRRQNELEIAKLEAERANQTKSSFLANMSHEIRTPLGAILGFTELLKAPNLDDEDKEQFLDIISRNGRALTRIIDDILDLAKVESGKLQTEEVEFSLSALLADVLDLFSENARAKGIELTVDVPVSAPEQISSDPTRLRQIFINIVGNAVKFTHEGFVSLRLRTEPTDGEELLFVVEVSDTGVGIPPAQRKKLFQPFVQADNTTTRQYGGTGLGLVLSNRLAGALGGSVRLADQGERRGSTFVISFRARRCDVVSSGRTTGPGPKLHTLPLKGKRILVADDSADNQLLIRNFLSGIGASVDTVSDGSAAVDRAMTGEYDIVLMDLQMPLMDGYAAVKSLRAAGYRKPIAALTAHAMEEERELTRAAGCDAHLTKPLDPPLMTKTLLALLDDK